MGRHSSVRWVASLVLFATASLKLLSFAVPNRYLWTADPVLEVPIWVVLTLAAATELGVGALLCANRIADPIAGAALLWFVSCSMVYRMVYSSVSGEPCPCLGPMPTLLSWGHGATNLTAILLLGCLGLSGATLILRANGDSMRGI